MVIRRLRRRSKIRSNRMFSSKAAALLRIRQKRRNLLCAAIICVQSKMNKRRWGVHPINEQKNIIPVIPSISISLEMLS